MLKVRLIRSPGVYAPLLVVVALLTAAAPDRRVVAIGDVHGDLVDFQAILQETGLANNARQWIGGGTVLVQTGDIVDRGPQSRECLDLLMALERQASKQQGKVIALLGNHEVMAMTGDLRYVSAEDFQDFSTAESEKIREEAYRDYLDFVSAPSDLARDAPAADTEAHGQWMREHPPGFFERRDAFGPQGVFGRWLRQHDAVAELGDVVFVHGGLNPNLPFHEIRELNQQIHSELAAFDALWQSLSKKKVIWRYMTIEEAIRQAQSEWDAIQTRSKVDAELKDDVQKFLTFPTWLINSPDSPTWYRGLALEPEERLASGVDAMLARLKIGFLVAAHTPQPNGRINARFGNRVFLIDTGMLHSVFGGRASALEMRGGRFSAYYTDETPQVFPAPGKIARSSFGPSKEMNELQR